jgi:hypothetical protein
VAAAVEGTSFPLEREEAAGVALGAEASEAATSSGAALDLAFLDGGSMKPSSLRKETADKNYERNTSSKSQNMNSKKKAFTYRRDRLRRQSRRLISSRAKLWSPPQLH